MSPRRRTEPKSPSAVPVDDSVIELIETALAEDVGTGDVTTQWTVQASSAGVGTIVAKAEGVVAGLLVAEAVFRRLSGRLRFTAEAHDGQDVAPGDLIATIEGPLRGILTGERTALNFLQRLSGIATLTRRYVAAVEGTGTSILDTRKTTPGWRMLEKAAVRAGGGRNHRTGLYDMVLVKENHIAAAGGIVEALRRVRESNEAGLAVEIEVRDVDELKLAVSEGVQRVLLDNMPIDTLRKAVSVAREVNPEVELEASGNMTLRRVGAVAATGVDLISVGALTHSAPALDLSLLVREA